MSLRKHSSDGYDSDCEEKEVSLVYNTTSTPRWSDVTKLSSNHTFKNGAEEDITLKASEGCSHPQMPVSDKSQKEDENFGKSAQVPSSDQSSSYSMQRHSSPPTLKIVGELYENHNPETKPSKPKLRVMNLQSEEVVAPNGSLLVKTGFSDRDVSSPSVSKEDSFKPSSDLRTSTDLSPFAWDEGEGSAFNDRDGDVAFCESQPAASIAGDDANQKEQVDFQVLDGPDLINLKEPSPATSVLYNSREGEHLGQSMQGGQACEHSEKPKIIQENRDEKDLIDFQTNGEIEDTASESVEMGAENPEPHVMNRVNRDTQRAFPTSDASITKAVIKHPAVLELPVTSSNQKVFETSQAEGTVKPQASDADGKYPADTQQTFAAATDVKDLIDLHADGDWEETSGTPLAGEPVDNSEELLKEGLDIDPFDDRDNECRNEEDLPTTVAPSDLPMNVSDSLLPAESKDNKKNLSTQVHRSTEETGARQDREITQTLTTGKDSLLDTGQIPVADMPRINDTAAVPVVKDPVTKKGSGGDIEENPEDQKLEIDSANEEKGLITGRYGEKAEENDSAQFDPPDGGGRDVDNLPDDQQGGNEQLGVQEQGEVVFDERHELEDQPNLDARGQQPIHEFCIRCNDIVPIGHICPNLQLRATAEYVPDNARAFNDQYDF